MAEPKVRSRLNYDKDKVSYQSGLLCPEETRTQQQFADEADINTLVRRFHVTGELPKDVRMPTFEDFSDVYDFHTAANSIAQANEAFEQMPAAVRFRFHNDPAEFVAFCSDDRNRPEAEKLGLVPVKPVAVPFEAAPAAPAGSAGEGAPTSSTT